MNVGENIDEVFCKSSVPLGDLLQSFWPIVQYLLILKVEFVIDYFVPAKYSWNAYPQGSFKL